MGKRKRLSDSQREAFKKVYGIRLSENGKRKCRNCLSYTNQICSKYHILTRPIETCESFVTRGKIAVYKGGSASSK